MTFHVSVTGLDDVVAHTRKVVYHGVNKSGSLVMTNVLHDGYHAARRANQFFSTYKGIPRDLGQLQSILASSGGHSFFGAHYLYDSVPLRREEHVLTTQFRHPLPRVRSCYQWIRNKAEASGGTYAEFEKWVVSTRGVRHSQVAQFGLGFAPGSEERLKTADGEELLERSMKNIEEDVAFFGIAEYFEESAFCMAAICGLTELPAWQRDDRNANRPLVQEWPQEQIDLVREVYKWDFELYEWVVDIFLRRLRTVTFGPDLAPYKAACADQYKDRLAVSGEMLPGEHTP